MKKFILSLFLALMATTGLYAQQISVVSTGGETSLYRTLTEAIQGAEPGSVIYLPGGGFAIDDTVKISKKLTIIGIGYKSNNDNVDGVTTISCSNLFFDQGSDGSAVMGCYITGNVWVGYYKLNSASGAVCDFLIKNCRLRTLYVSSQCTRTVVSQNYINEMIIRSDAYINNNVITRCIQYVKGGTIINNIILGDGCSYTLYMVYDTTIVNNVIKSGSKGCIGYSDYIDYRGANCHVSNNMAPTDLGDDCINIGETDWTNVFADFSNTISPNNDYHFKGIYQQYENQVGIYAGPGFGTKAPVPYIIAKDVKEQTDASGKLNVKFRVKASE